MRSNFGLGKERVKTKTIYTLLLKYIYKKKEKK